MSVSDRPSRSMVTRVLPFSISGDTAVRRTSNGMASSMYPKNVLQLNVRAVIRVLASRVEVVSCCKAIRSTPVWTAMAPARISCACASSALICARSADRVDDKAVRRITLKIVSATTTSVSTIKASETSRSLKNGRVARLPLSIMVRPPSVRAPARPPARPVRPGPRPRG